MVHITPGPQTVTDAHQGKLDALEKKFQNAALEIAQLDQKLHEPLYKERSEIVKDLPQFWAQVFINLTSTGIYVDEKDHDALSHLTDLTLSKPSDLRGLTLNFHFSENPYFSNSTLTKTFTANSEAPQFPEFELSEDSTCEITKVDWKSDDKNLAKLYPTKGDVSEEDFEPGSFFSTFFESESNQVSSGLATLIEQELYPRALDIYSGKHSPIPAFEDYDEDEDDEDDEAEEIDLEDEEPAKKKKKTE